MKRALAVGVGCIAATRIKSHIALTFGGTDDWDMFRGQNRTWGMNFRDVGPGARCSLLCLKGFERTVNAHQTLGWYDSILY